MDAESPLSHLRRQLSQRESQGGAYVDTRNGAYPHRIRSIPCFTAFHPKRGAVHIGNAPDFRFPRLTPPRIRGILSFREVTLL